MTQEMTVIGIVQKKGKEEEEKMIFQRKMEERTYMNQEEKLTKKEINGDGKRDSSEEREKIKKEKEGND